MTPDPMGEPAVAQPLRLCDQQPGVAHRPAGAERRFPDQLGAERVAQRLAQQVASERVSESRRDSAAFGLLTGCWSKVAQSCFVTLRLFRL